MSKDTRDMIVQISLHELCDLKRENADLKQQLSERCERTGYVAGEMVFAKESEALGVANREICSLREKLRVSEDDRCYWKSQCYGYKHAYADLVDDLVNKRLPEASFFGVNIPPSER